MDATETVDEVKSDSGDVAMDGASDSQKPKRKLPEDDIPWCSLASFALHKLFLDWEQQGMHVPIVSSKIGVLPIIPIKPVIPQAIIRAPTPATTVAPTGPPLPMKKIPEDANKRNPVQILNQLRPGCCYSEKRDGPVSNLTFTITVNIDGQEFIGVAANKREAKRECAKAALMTMGVVYDN